MTNYNTADLLQRRHAQIMNVKCPKCGAESPRFCDPTRRAFHKERTKLALHKV